MRDSWLADTDMAILRGGIYGMGGEGHCAHSHCDLLSFVLWVNGQSVLVDSGTYTYHGPWRDHFRLTAAHNTVKVDDSEQALADTYFNWRQIPEAHCVNWTGNRVKATMTCVDQIGFTRDLSHPQPGTWNLTDEFTGEDQHSLEWFFHFSPDLELELNVDGHKLTVIATAPFLTMRLRKWTPFSSETRGIRNNMALKVIMHCMHSGTEY
ncbi:heparinase II/III-family protein [Candidatus Villigracilis affinis]|uniref:heparinase II/III family protein n=1 Tax=Candidatus Villigracilis affinis TaxID=3140682 RepID=UPI0031EBE6F3